MGSVWEAAICLRLSLNINCRKSPAYQEYRTTPLPAKLVVTLENSPSKVPAAVQPFHFGGRSDKGSIVCCAAPLTTKEAPGSVWNVAPITRSGT